MRSNHFWSPYFSEVAFDAETVVTVTKGAAGMVEVSLFDRFSIFRTALLRLNPLFDAFPTEEVLTGSNDDGNFENVVANAALERLDVGAVDETADFVAHSFSLSLLTLPITLKFNYNIQLLQ